MTTLTCGAKTRSGAPCRKLPMANGRCRNHGGATPAGPASPHFKTGLRSRWGLLPKEIAQRYAETSKQTDEALMALSQEIALVDAAMGQELGAMRTGDGTEAGWERVLRLIGERRKLVETESRRRRDAQELITLGQAAALTSVLVHVVKSHVTDRAVLASIHRDLACYLGRKGQPLGILTAAKVNT